MRYLPLVFLLACGGPTVDGQHDACDTDADCPTGDGLTCVEDTNGDKTCEVVCTSDEDCPEYQSCDGSETDDGICWQGPA